MNHILDKRKSDHFNTPVPALLNGVKKGLFFACGFALVLMLQATFFSSGAIASPLAGLFGNKVEEITQGVKTDMAIDKAAGITKEIGRDLRDGRTDKVIDKLAETSKDFAKNVKEVAKDTKDKIGNGVDKAKEMASDRTNEVKAEAKDLPEKAGNKVDEAIDSVKNIFGQ